MNKLFKRVAGANPGRSVFNLSYEKKLTCDMGQLIPIMCDEVVPGDIFEIGNQIVARCQPMVAPPLHEVDVYVHYYFQPYRLLWDEWEDFITGGVDGSLVPVLPRWEPTAGQTAEGTLWDYLGFPTGIIPLGATPMDFPRRAYYEIYNQYYRDESLQPEIDYLTDTSHGEILNRDWEKDYFTSAQTRQQRGTSPAFPITGLTSAVWEQSSFTLGGTGLTVTGDASLDQLHINNAGALPHMLNTFNDNIVDLSSATPLDITEIRLGFQIQRWLERNQRAGVRYTEFLGAHFGVNPRDDRLDRPEYIGGCKFPLIISEVLQTSETNTTPQGNLAGHGIGANASYVAKYRATEFGLIMGIMSIMPKPSYQQGINRQWLRTTKYDFYFPEFAHLSEQAIIRAELYTSNVPAENQTLFGYCGAYDEMRVKHNQVCGEFRSTYDYWHIGRQFASPPLLNASFVECVPRKDFLAAPSEPAMLVQFGNIIKAIRPMPIIAEPGLIDHG